MTRYAGMLQLRGKMLTFTDYLHNETLFLIDSIANAPINASFEHLYSFHFIQSMFIISRKPKIMT